MHIRASSNGNNRFLMLSTYGNHRGSDAFRSHVNSVEPRSQEAATITPRRCYCFLLYFYDCFTFFFPDTMQFLFSGIALPLSC